MHDRDEKCIQMYSWQVEGLAYAGHSIEAHEEMG